MDTKTRKQNISSALFCIAVFVCMFVFFFCCHPIVVLDADDWQYLSYVRPAVPYTGFWNPSRILPEILMPFCGTVALAVFRIFPVGYIEAQTAVFGFTLAAFITAYVYAFVRLMETKFRLSRQTAFLFGALFLSLHFLIFRTEASGNLYMFSSYDACCYFYYTIPALLNCTLVMFFSYTSTLNTFFTPENLLKKGLLVAILYLAIFSNLFNSIILVAYLGCDFLMDLVYIIRRKEKFASLLKADLFQLIIIFVWLIAVFLESRGGRGFGYWPRKEYFNNIRATAALSAEIFKSFNLLFVAIGVLSVAAAAVTYLAERKKSRLAPPEEADISDADISDSEGREFSGFANSNAPADLSGAYLFEFFDLHLSSACVIFLFLVLLCARVEKNYFTRPQVMFGYIFSLFVIIMSCIAYVIKKHRQLIVFLPLTLLIVLSIINTQDITFAPSNTIGLSEQACISADNDLIAQMTAADSDGTERLALQVMNTGINDNWPHTPHVAYGLKQTLLKHGIILRNFEIVPEMSKDFNERNGIHVEFFWPDEYRSFYPTLY